MVEKAANLINNYLKDHSHTEKIKMNLYTLLTENLDKDWLKGCEEHYAVNIETIIKSTIAICLKRFCKIKNGRSVQKSWKRKINILKNV